MPSEFKSGDKVTVVSDKTPTAYTIDHFYGDYAHLRDGVKTLAVHWTVSRKHEPGIGIEEARVPLRRKKP